MEQGNHVDGSVTVHGIHHVTCISGDAQENLDFYIGVLGMRLVKRSVNQDAIETYHFFYADGAGNPGSELTFFPWPQLSPARMGVGQTVEILLAIPKGSLAYWQECFEQNNVKYGAREERFGEATLPFEDPHGLRLALVETHEWSAFSPWSDSAVPAEHQIRGVHAVRLLVADMKPTEGMLQRLGFASLGVENGWHRYAVEDGLSGQLVEVKADPQAGYGRGGTGGTHHVAWRVRDSEGLLAVRDVVRQSGGQPTPEMDRFWFRSVYFHEPGGVLFELATDGPGFAVDEDPDHLGERLILPPWLEARREEIEAMLPPIDPPI